VKLYGLTAIASSLASAKPAEAYPPTPKASADYPLCIHLPRRNVGVAFPACRQTGAKAGKIRVTEINFSLMDILDIHNNKLRTYYALEKKE